jgi:hypothetical protein
VTDALTDRAATRLAPAEAAAAAGRAAEAAAAAAEAVALYEQKGNLAAAARARAGRTPALA